MARKPPPASTLTEAAEAITRALEEMARLSARAAELEPTSWDEIAKGGELLGKATAAHERFVVALGRLTGEIGVLRDRHNGYVEQLAGAAATVDQRRLAYAALEERFGVISAAAVEIGELARAAPAPPADPTAHAAAVSVTFAAIRERLARAVEDTSQLANDAREAGLRDLEKRATTARRQLEGLLGQLVNPTGPAS